MSRELMPKSGIMMPHVVVTRDAAVVGVSTVDGFAGAIDLTDKYLQKTDASATYQTKAEGASKTYVLDSIQPIMEGALFKADPFVDNDIPFRSAGANGVESVDMIKVTPENSIKLGSYESSVQGVEIHSAGRLQVVDQNDSGTETKYPVYSKRYRPEIEDLPFAAIGSYVKDSKGRTIGVNRTGINSDIKQFTQKVTFQHPVTLADGVGDYDAVTMRQLRNSGGGSGGPTMSGISNFGIGDFHLRDSRAFIPAFEVPSDGQLLSRTEYPDLWAYAQLLTPIEDSLWLGDAKERGKYSLGDGSTTFRVPDRNGAQTGSIKSLFARGDGGNSSINGAILESYLPNITGRLSFHGALPDSSGYTVLSSVSGAFINGAIQNRYVDQAPVNGGSATSVGRADLDASRSSSAYGRNSLNTDEVLPRNFTGVWTIRAHGGFTAANTSWSVINSDATAPENGITVKGGKVRSVYKVGTSEYGVAELQSSVSTDSTGTRTVGAEVVVTDSTSGAATSKTIKLGTVDGLTGGEIGSIITVRGAGLQPKLVASHLDYNPVLGGNAIWIVGMNEAENIMKYVTEVTGQYYSLTTVFRVAGQQQFWSQTSTGRYLTPLGELAIQGSDVRIKDNFEEPKEGAWDRVKSIGICEFTYKGQNVTQRGFLAQQMGEIDSVYTFEGGTAHDDDGNEFEIINVNDRAVLADVITVMQMMQDKIKAMESEIAELKSNK